MSEYIRRGECLEAVAKVNSVLARFEERIRQIQKDMNKLKAENKALKDKVQILASWREFVGGVVAKHADRIQTLEIKNEGLSARTIGWQDGFGKSVRDQFRRIDERFEKLLASDDSADFEISQWIEEVSKLRKDFSALKKRVEFVEKFKPVIVKEEPPSVPQPIWPTYQPTRTVPGTGNPNPMDPPWKITCQTKDEACE